MSQLLLCDSPRKLPEENLSPENLPREGNYDFVASLHSDLSVADPSGGLEKIMVLMLMMNKYSNDDLQ